MEIVRTVAAALIVLAGSGCNPRDVDTSTQRRPAIYWSGYLEELEGRPVPNSGIKLELIGDDPDNVAYNLSTGCVAGGVVDREGRADPWEVLRPCLTEDLQRLGRINLIAPSALTGEPQSPVTLTWTNDAAVLKSGQGEARFRRIE